MSDPLSQPAVITNEQAIEWLGRLLTFYAGEEEVWYGKTYLNHEGRGWSKLNENEWMRYRMESAALRAGIAALETK